MGSGKTTVGKKVASALTWNFIDLDREIERITGQLVKDIFSEKGEDGFRRIETDVLQSLIFTDNTIVSCGGGTPCFHSNMEFMLGNGLTVYLKMDAEQLKSRLVNSHHVRPLIKDIPPDELSGYIRNSLEQREKWYNQCEIVINSMNLDIESLKDTIIKKL